MFWLIFGILLVVGIAGLMSNINMKKPIFLVLAFVGILGFLFSMIITVPAGHIGVVYDPFAGGVQQEELMEGFHLVLPWKEITMMSIRTQTYNMHAGGDDVTLPTLTAEGLEVQIDVSVIYHIDKNSAWSLYQNVGEEYEDILIKPTTRALVRDLVAQYRAEDLYATEKRVGLQNNLKTKVKEHLEARGLVVEAVLVRDIQLPRLIKMAIESKLEAEQQAKRMEFVLEKEQKEAQRKVIEANGEAQKMIIKANATAESQQIIASTLNEQYIKWLWVSNLQNNPGIYYVPIGADGLPLLKTVE